MGGSMAMKAFEVALKAFLPTALGAAREVAGYGKNPFFTKPETEETLGRHVEEVAGVSRGLVSEKTGFLIEEHLHRGVAAAFSAGESIAQGASDASGCVEKYRLAVRETLRRAGYDANRVFSLTVLPVVKRVGEFAGNLFSSMVERGSRVVPKTAAALAVVALSAVLLAASPSEGFAPNDYSKRFDEMAASSLSMEESRDGMRILSEHVRKTAVKTLEHEAKMLSDSADTTGNDSRRLRVVVNRAALERDISSVRFLALLAEKNPSKKKMLAERFSSEKLDFVCVAERMREDAEFLRACASAAGMKNHWKMRQEKAVRELFEKYAGVALPEAPERERVEEGFAL